MKCGYANGMNPEMNKKIAIIGAGSIGCYVGGRLAAAGANVNLVGRARIGEAIRQHGLHVTDYLDYEQQLPLSDTLTFSESLDNTADADLILVCVKSAATAEVAQDLAQRIAPSTLIISLQNGLNNAAVLREHLPNNRCLAGMVQFNVINRGDGKFHQGSEGGLECEADSATAPLLPLFEASGLGLEQPQDFLAVQWAKLLLNLNNPINALSGVPLKEELSQRDFRRCLAAAQAEALSLLNQAGIKPAKLTPLPPHWIPKLLTVPTWMFKLLANKMLAIDPLARSSMWEDLEAGRKTEIDYLNGEVVALAEKLGTSARINHRLIELIRDAENGGKRDWQAAELLQTITD